MNQQMMLTVVATTLGALALLVALMAYYGYH